MQMFPREVVLSIVVLDLPIVLHEKSYVQMKDGFGASWWYINCDCDDFYFDVVEDVISLCSLPQVRAMCFMKKDGDDKVSLLSRATPRCRAALQSALRFVNRYEFVDSQPIESNPAKGLQIFDALDFGTTLKPIPNGKRVLLSCYSKYESFIQEVRN